MSYCVQVKTTGKRRNKMASDLIPSPQNNFVNSFTCKNAGVKLFTTRDDYNKNMRVVPTTEYTE
jgi:hypothetical protein